MKNNNKRILMVGALIVIILGIVLIMVLTGDKKLDLESEIVTNLYKYLGETDINHCGGLSTYNGSTVTPNDITTENKLCMAYFALDLNKIKTDTAEVTDTNKNGTKICKIGEGTILATNTEEGETCDYRTIAKDELNSSYKSLYGEDIKDYNNFYTSSTNTCILEGDNYYCGEGETYQYSIAAEATIYRLIDKAAKKGDDIFIYDYFLKVTNNTCYVSSNNENENNKCSEKLSDNPEINEAFVKKYGKIYKHTFTKDKNNNYYWVKSEVN